MTYADEARAEAERRMLDPKYNHDPLALFVQGAAWLESLLSDSLHEHWNTAPIEEMRSALAFQGGMTRALLEEQREWLTPRKVEFTDEQVEVVARFIVDAVKGAESPGFDAFHTASVALEAMRKVQS